LATAYVSKIYDHNKKGDPLFVKPKLLADSTYSSLKVLWMARPITDNDIDTMTNVSAFDKKVLKAGIIPNEKPFLIESGWQVSFDSLRKYRTFNIGNYVNGSIVNTHFRHYIICFYFFEFKPDERILYYSGEDKGILPKGYMIDNKTRFYIRQDKMERVN
jgi:hypothetical protein